MVEREVRYCTTADGVRIAYTVTGEGSPLLFCAEPTTSHVQLEWSHPALGQWMRRLSDRNAMVRFDHRGFGLSDRVVASALDEWVLDIEAVAERAGFERFALVGAQLATPAAITFAARHPGRVVRLALVDGFARWSDFLSSPQVQAIQAAARLEFTTATETIGFAALGTGDEARQHGAYIRACVAPEAFVAYDTYGAWDASESAGAIACPTLVLRHAGLEYVTLEMAKDLASRVRDAQLAVIDGKWLGDDDEAVTRIDSFINGGPRAETPRQDTGSGVRTVLFTDLVGHTEMMQRLGDDRGRDVLREHERITRELLKQHGGAEVKTMGDGFMASFGSVTKAMDCAIALQQSFAVWNDDVGAQRAAPLHVRVGLNAGEPIEEDGDLFGSTVIMASRIAAQAGAGEILIPEPLRHLLTGKSYVYADRGETMLKGFEDAVRLYEVRWRE